MSNPNKNKPGGKPGQRSPKPEQARSQKPVQPLSLKPAQPQSQKPVQLPSLPPEPVQQQSKTPVQQQDSSKPFDAARMPINTPSIDFQTIATAYSDYSKKSFEQTKAFVEKLAGVRSLDKAIEIQTEFAKQAYETFVTESQKIRGLYSGLARQTFKPLEGLLPR
jgi:Phasin protein